MLIKVKDYVFNTGDIIYVRPHTKQMENKTGVVVRLRDYKDEFFEGLCANDFVDFMNQNLNSKGEVI